MKFEKIRYLPDYKVKTNKGKLIGYIRERSDGWWYKPLSKEFIGLTPDKTLIQAKKRAEIWFEINAPYLGEGFSNVSM